MLQSFFLTCFNFSPAMMSFLLKRLKIIKLLTIRRFDNDCAVVMFNSITITCIATIALLRDCINTHSSVSHIGLRKKVEYYTDLC